MQSKYRIIFLSIFVGLFFGPNKKWNADVSFKTYSWNNPPVVLNCYGDSLNDSYITQSLSYWETKGEKTTGLISNPSAEQCSGKHKDGHIIIKKASKNQLPPNTLAVTHRNTNKSAMKAATIYFEKGAFRKKYLMSHEIGHAHGYGHVEISGHIMNPKLEYMGSKFWVP